MRRTAAIFAVTLSAVFGVLAAGACSPSVETLCKRLCDCGDCSSEEETGCVEGLEDAEKDASDEECGAEYDAYTTCLDEQVECKDGGANDEACDGEKDDLAQCLDKPVIVLVGDACIDLCEKITACEGLDPALCSVGENPCTYGQNKCAACLAGSGGDICNPEDLINAALPCLTLCLDALECQPGTELPCQCEDGSTGVSQCNGTAIGPCQCAAPQ